MSERVWETTFVLILSSPARLLLEIQPHLVVLDAWLKAPTDAVLKERWESESRPAVIRALRRRTQPLWIRGLGVVRR